MKIPYGDDRNHLNTSGHALKKQHIHYQLQRLIYRTSSLLKSTMIVSTEHNELQVLGIFDPVEIKSCTNLMTRHMCGTLS